MPDDADPAGDIFGGWLTRQMDLAAGNLAARTAHGRAATITADGIRLPPARQGGRRGVALRDSHPARAPRRTSTPPPGGAAAPRKRARRSSAPPSSSSSPTRTDGLWDFLYDPLRGLAGYGPWPVSLRKGRRGMGRLRSIAACSRATGSLVSGPEAPPSGGVADEREAAGDAVDELSAGHRQEEAEAEPTPGSGCARSRGAA